MLTEREVGAWNAFWLSRTIRASRPSWKPCFALGRQASLALDGYLRAFASGGRIYLRSGRPRNRVRLLVRFLGVCAVWMDRRAFCGGHPFHHRACAQPGRVASEMRALSLPGANPFLLRQVGARLGLNAVMVGLLSFLIGFSITGFPLLGPIFPLCRRSASVPRLTATIRLT